MVLFKFKGWFCCFLKAWTNLWTSSVSMSSMDVLPNPKSLKCLRVNLLWSLQYLPWHKMMPGFLPSNSGSSHPGLHSLFGRMGGLADNSSFCDKKLYIWTLWHFSLPCRGPSIFGSLRQVKLERSPDKSPRGLHIFEQHIENCAKDWDWNWYHSCACTISSQLRAILGAQVEIFQVCKCPLQWRGARKRGLLTPKVLTAWFHLFSTTEKHWIYEAKSYLKRHLRTFISLR